MTTKVDKSIQAYIDRVEALRDDAVDWVLKLEWCLNEMDGMWPRCPYCDAVRADTKDHRCSLGKFAEQLRDTFYPKSSQ